MKLNLLLLSAAVTMADAALRGLTSSAPPSDYIEYTNGVELGTAADYVILAKTGISTVPTSVIKGHIAVSPIGASAITGFGLIMDTSARFSKSNQVDLTSEVYAADYTGAGGTYTPAALTTAVGNMETAYTYAMGVTTTDDEKINKGDGEIGGTTLFSGVYKFTTDIKISTPVKFSGNADSVFIMQTSGSVVQAESTAVELIGGVKPENIFWVVAGQVVVGKGSTMKGVLLVKTAAVFNTGAVLDGRCLAQTAVTLQQAIITEFPART
jgi:hypothetical protein